MLEIRKCKMGDAVALSRSLRNEDLREIQAASGDKPLLVILRGLMESDPDFAYCIVNKHTKDVLAIGGITPSEVKPRTGHPWMLCSTHVRGHRVTMYRACLNILRSSLKKYGYLSGLVYSKNKLHIAWLRLLGFDLLPGIPAGKDNEPFHFFNIHDYQVSPENV